MRIARATLHQLRIPFRFAFRHALAERKESDALVLRLEDERGRTGFGEAAPRPYVSGETPETVRETLQNLLPAVAGTEIPSFDAAAQELDSILTRLHRSQHAAFACLDIGLLDLAGRAFGCAAASSLGDIVHQTLDYSAVISAEAPAEVQEVLRKAKDLGFRGFKLKLGEDAEKDLYRLDVARTLLGDDCSLRADANCAWKSADDALRRLETLHRFRLDGLEQPLPAADIDGMARLTAHGSIRIIADESLVSLTDADRLAARKACHCFNVRISKCGGLSGALKIRSLADRAGIEVMLGAHVGETAILSAAGRQFGTRSPRTLFFEGSYGKLLLEDDLAPDLTVGPGGRGGAIAGVGLGIEVDEARLDAWTTHKQELLP